MHDWYAPLSSRSCRKQTPPLLVGTSNNDTTQPSPIDDIRARLDNSSPLPWSNADIRDASGSMSANDLNRRGNEVVGIAQAIMDKRNALARKVSGLRGLAGCTSAAPMGHFCDPCRDGEHADDGRGGHCSCCGEYVPAAAPPEAEAENGAL